MWVWLFVGINGVEKLVDLLLGAILEGGEELGK